MRSTEASRSILARLGAIVCVASIATSAHAVEAADAKSANLSVEFKGMRSVHVDVWSADGAPGEVSGSQLARSYWRNDGATLVVPAAKVDVRVRQGGATLVADGVDCTRGSCRLDQITAKLIVKFQGMRSVHTDARVPDGVEGTAQGETATRANWRNDVAELVVLRKIHDVLIRQGGSTLVVDDVNCTSGRCEVDDITAKIRILFAGLRSVHSDARVPDGEPDSASGAEVTRSNWRTDQAELMVFRKAHDLRIRQGGATYVVDDYLCNKDLCEVGNLTAELSVEFEGMGSVHTDARMPDGEKGTATGDEVARANWKSHRADMKVLRGIYDIRVRRGGATRVVDDLDCRGASCKVGDLTAKMVVLFDGMSSVHSDARMPDEAKGTANGAEVARSNWRSGKAEMMVFQGHYDVRVRQGAATYIRDDFHCDRSPCTVDGLTAKMKVSFDGMSSVHTDAVRPDGRDGAAQGDGVARSYWKSGGTEMTVLRGVYDVKLRQGAMTHVVDDVDCEDGACEVGGVTAKLRVLFEGLTSAHTDVWAPDGKDGAIGDGKVTSAYWKTDKAEMVVFQSLYDVRVRRGGAARIVDNVDCRSEDTCEVKDLTSKLRVLFAGMSSVHSDARVPDGEAGVAEGAEVMRANWRSNLAEMLVLKGYYDVRVRRGGATRIVDDVDCRIDETCLVDGLTAKMKVLFEGMSSVHTDARVPDGEKGTASGHEVMRANWRQNLAEMVVFAGAYDVRVRRGGATLVVDDFPCNPDACTVDGLTSKLTVQFAGLKSVHTDARIPDDEAGVAGGAEVVRANWRSNLAEMVILKGHYDVRVRQGGGMLVVDRVDCTAASCDVREITSELTVTFPGLTGVHTDARVPDDVAGQAEGSSVANSNWRSHEAILKLLRGYYDVKVRHGATTVFDAVACTGETCSAEITGNAQASLVDGDTGAAIAGKYLYAYEKMPSGKLYFAQKGTTSEEGKVNFSLDGLGDGHVFVLKTYNAFGHGKTYYSPLLTRVGPFRFAITADGEYPLDDDPPEVAIVFPTATDTVSVDGFTVTGTVGDNNEVDGVTVTVVDGDAGTSVIDAMLDAAGTGWSASVGAGMITRDSTIEITATATDRALNQASDQVSVRVIEDTTPPSIRFTSHGDGDPVEETGFLVRGVVEDNTSVQSLVASLVDQDGAAVFQDRSVEFDRSGGAWAVAVGNGEVGEGEQITLSLTATDAQSNSASAAIGLVVVAGDDLSAHMVSRTTFGVTPALKEEVSALGALGFLTQQLDADLENDDYDPGFEPTTKEELQHYVLMHMIESRWQLVEMMAWFWDNHFNTDVDKPGNTVAYEIAEYRQFRQNALGNFVDLLLISAQSPAMLYYLDNISNSFADANENYTREVMELHTMGVDGGYTPDDIEAGAELFTGWRVQDDAFFFNPAEHNQDPQIVLSTPFPAAGADGGLSRGVELLALLAGERSTSLFVCSKLVTFLVDDVPPQSLVVRCADTFQDELANDDQIAIVVEEILTSGEFADAARSKLKTPIDLVVGVLRALDAGGDRRDVARAVSMIGLELNANPVPTGYSVVADDWVSTNLLVERIRWVNALVREPVGGESSYVEPIPYLRGNGVTTTEGIVAYLADLLFDDDLLGEGESTGERATAEALLEEGASFDIDAANADEKLRRLLGTMLSYPSYQYK